MIIIHKVGDFLGELFPRYKSSGFDEEILKEFPDVKMYHEMDELGILEFER